MNELSSFPTQYSVCFFNSIRKHQHFKDKKLRCSHYPACMFWFIIKGSGTLMIDNEIFDLKEQQLYFFSPDMHIEVSLISESLEYYTITFEHFSGAALGGKNKGIHIRHVPLPLFTSGYVRIYNFKQIHTRIQQLDEDSRNEPDEFSIHLQFQELLYLIMKDHSGYLDKTSTKNGIDQTIEYMQKNFRDKIDMGMLSAMAGLTASSFSRLFKKTRGVTPTEYLTRLRIESAKRMLSRNDCRIKEVSLAVGYDDEFYFSRIFHRLVGVSPTFYMKKTRMRVDELPEGSRKQRG